MRAQSPLCRRGAMPLGTGTLAQRVQVRGQLRAIADFHQWYAYLGIILGSPYESQPGRHRPTDPPMPSIGTLDTSAELPMMSDII